MILLAVALLLGSAAAFTRTEQLKLDRAPIGAPRFDRQFSPVCACARQKARLSLLLRRPERLDLTVVDLDGEPVRLLASDFEPHSGRFELEWNGRDDSGRIVPDGAYRVRVHLDRARRTILIPVEVHVDTKPPAVRLLGVLPDATFSPDGDGIDDTIQLRYTATEAGRPILLVDGRVAVRGERRKSGPFTLAWDGSIRSRTVAPGVHQVAIEVGDRAGNRSEPTEPVAIVVSAAR